MDPPAQPQALRPCSGSSSSSPSHRASKCVLSSGAHLTPPSSPSSPPSSPSRMLPPRTRFQLPFPSRLERGFATFDDRVVALCQRRTDGLVHAFSMGLTFFTSIEVSLVAPPTLYALGYDIAAGLCSSVLLVLGIVSQVPKKFIYRPRPWMVGRALPIRKDRTSSFPSRAVVCAVVFSWLIAQSLHLEGLLTQPLSRFKLWAAILGVACLTAFARINVGAHYPSDTILGFVLGVLVILCGSRLEQRVWQRVCPLSSMYAEPPASAALMAWSDVRAEPTRRRTMLMMTLVAYGMTLVSIQGFWVKCSYVYGLLMACETFRAALLCAPARASAAARLASVVEKGGLKEHVYAVGTYALLLLFGMATRAKKGAFRVLSFSLIYGGTLGALLWWRVGS